MSGFDLLGSGGVKSTQNGNTQVNNGAQFLDITISPVDIANSVIKIDSYSTSSSLQRAFRAEFINNNTIRVTRDSTAGLSRLIWTVIEFDKLKSKQSGTCSVSSESKIESISPINPTKSLLYFTYSSTHDDASQIYVSRFLSGLLSGNNIEFVRGTVTTGQCTVNWDVVEFE